MSLIIGREAEKTVRQLKESEVIVHGHFEFHSGRHSDTYLDKRQFFQTLPEVFNDFCKRIAESILTEGFHAIIAPEEAGVIVAERVIANMPPQRFPVAFVRAHKTPTGFLIDPADRRKFAGKCFAVVEDVVTTGSTALEVGQIAREMGGSFNAIYCLFERGYHHRISGVPIRPVLQIDLPSWEAPCRLCNAGVPLSPKPMGGATLPFTN